MHDIKLLEEEWEKYNKKKRKPYYLAGSTILMIVALLFLFSKFYLNSKHKISKVKSSKITVNINNSVLLDQDIRELALNKQDSIEKEVIDLKPATTAAALDNAPMEIEKYSNIDMIKKPKIKTEIKKITKPVLIKKPRKKIHLNIIKTASEEAYKDVEKRFKVLHDTDDSIFLAKQYYKKGKYKKAEYWALETNKINNNIEDSWLIFAKVQVKLGHRVDAKKALISYIKKTKSNKARELLYKIEKNTF